MPWTSELVMQETFGPVIPIIRVPNDIESVIRISNATAFGLSSGVCTNRLDYITRFVSELDVGTVNSTGKCRAAGIGDVAVRRDQGSGLGYKEGVQEAIEELHQRQDLLAALARP